MNNTDISEIIGGLDHSMNEFNDDNIVILGGVEHNVGERTTWEIQNKIIQFKNTKPDAISNLLHIVGVKIPITFDDNVYYDTDKIPTVVNANTKINTKAHIALDTRINISVSEHIQVILNAYDMESIIRNALFDIIKLLIGKIKEKRPAMRQVKIHPDILMMYNTLDNGKNPFTITTSLENAPRNMIELLISIINTYVKTRPAAIEWESISNMYVPYPELSSEVEELVNSIITKFNSESPNSTIHTKVNILLEIELALLPYISAIEQYIIKTAKNISYIYKHFNNSTNSSN